MLWCMIPRFRLKIKQLNLVPSQNLLVRQSGARGWHRNVLVILNQKNRSTQDLIVGSKWWDVFKTLGLFARFTSVPHHPTVGASQVCDSSQSLLWGGLVSSRAASTAVRWRGVEVHRVTETPRLPLPPTRKNARKKTWRRKTLQKIYVCVDTTYCFYLHNY